MANRTLTIIAAVAAAALLALLYLGMGTDEEAPSSPEPVAEAPPALPPPRTIETTPPPAPPQAPEPAPAPVEVEPEIAQAAPPETAAEVEADPLPRLDRSDDFVLSRIAELEGGNDLRRLLVDQEVVRRFVIFVENVSRGLVPQQELPLRPIQTPIQVRELGENDFVLEPASYARFDGMLETLLEVDTAHAMAIYSGIKPLLQEAYAEIGFRGRDFDEVLARAIDAVLEAEVPEGPYLLHRPSVMYRFADEDIEDLSLVEKQLLRLGPENTQRLQTKLREFRARLPGG